MRKQCSLAYIEEFITKWVSDRLNAVSDRDLGAAHEPQQGIATGRHRQALRQLRPSFASLREGDLGECLGLSQGTPGVGAREQREASAKVVRGHPRVRQAKRRTSRHAWTALF
jgi:hypothetical protein